MSTTTLTKTKQAQVNEIVHHPLIKDSLLGDCHFNTNGRLMFSNSNEYRYVLWMSLLPSSIEHKGNWEIRPTEYNTFLYCWLLDIDNDLFYQRWNCQDSLSLPPDFELNEYSLLGWMLGKGYHNKASNTLELCVKAPLSRQDYDILYKALVDLMNSFSGIIWRPETVGQSNYIGVDIDRVKAFFHHKDREKKVKKVFNDFCDLVLKI